MQAIELSSLLHPETPEFNNPSRITRQCIGSQIIFWLNVLAIVASIIISLFCIVGFAYGPSYVMPGYVTIIAIIMGITCLICMFISTIAFCIVILSEFCCTDSISKIVPWFARFSIIVATILVCAQINGAMYIRFRYNVLAFNFYTFGFGIAIELSLVFMLLMVIVLAALTTLVITLLRNLRMKYCQCIV